MHVKSVRFFFEKKKVFRRFLVQTQRKIMFRVRFIHIYSKLHILRAQLVRAKKFK